MEKRYNYKPSRGIMRACSGIVEAVTNEPYSEYMLLAESCVGRDWDEEVRARLIEAIRLNLIDKKLYPFEVLQRKYGLPCCQTTFRREMRKYVQVLSGLCGFE